MCRYPYGYALARLKGKTALNVGTGSRAFSKQEIMDIGIVIGRNLRAIRLGRKETIRVVAKATKVSATTISLVERGKRDCKLYILFAICKYYKIDPNKLFQGL